MGTQGHKLAAVLGPGRPQALAPGAGQVISGQGSLDRPCVVAASRGLARVQPCTRKAVPPLPVKRLFMQVFFIAI